MNIFDRFSSSTVKSIFDSKLQQALDIRRKIRAKVQENMGQIFSSRDDEVSEYPSRAIHIEDRSHSLPLNPSGTRSWARLIPTAVVGIGCAALAYRYRRSRSMVALVAAKEMKPRSKISTALQAMVVQEVELFIPQLTLAVFSRLGKILKERTISRNPPSDQAKKPAILES